MVTTENFTTLALSFPGVVENPHFDRSAFKVTNIRIFTTLHAPSRSVNVKFTPNDQAEFCSLGVAGIYPVPNKFGAQGWTTFELDQVEEDVLQAALETAYNDVLNSKKK